MKQSRSPVEQDLMDRTKPIFSRTRFAGAKYLQSMFNIKSGLPAKLSNQVCLQNSQIRYACKIVKSDVPAK
jgi:hypothetical protein